GGLAGGFRYPQDMQVQPMLAAALLLRNGRVQVANGCPVHAIDRDAQGRVAVVRTKRGDVSTGIVVNAAGTWGGEVSRLAGAEVRLLRTYSGFRPYCPDHLPVIGPDPRVPGLFQACGHEGAGIGLSAATGSLIAQAATGEATSIPLEPFSPLRFGATVAS